MKQFLEHVNGQCHEENGGTLVSWPTAVKFLMARKFDVKRAIELYKNHQVCLILYTGLQLLSIVFNIVQSVIYMLDLFRLCEGKKA